MYCSSQGERGGTPLIFWHRWAAEVLKLTLCLGQEILKIHTLVRQNSRILLPCLGQRTLTLKRQDLQWIGPTHVKLYTLFRSERMKTIPCPAANPCIVHITEYPTPPPPSRLQYCRTGSPVLVMWNIIWPVIFYNSSVEYNHISELLTAFYTYAS